MTASALPHLVFDFAGVLFHWQPLAMLQRELPHLAPDEAAARRLADAVFQGYGGDWGEFDRGTVEVPELVRRICTRTGLAPADVLRIVEAVPLELQAQPDSVALVEQLHDAGHRLFFLSNMPAPYADHLEAHNPFLRLFEDGVFSARVGHNKPEPGIYDTAALQFGVEAGRLLFLDDHLPNVMAARQQGWQALHFTSPAEARLALRQRGLAC